VKPTRARTVAAALLALAAFSAMGVNSAPAAVLNACTAADIIAQDANCPNGIGACTIALSFQVGDGCTLDFGARAVTITGTLDINSGTVTINAGTLTVAASGLIDGRGNGSTMPTSMGGMITIQTSGAVTVQKSASGKGINVSGNDQAGTAVINAAGSINVAGTINASQLPGASGATGGTIQLNAGGDITIPLGSNVSATGGIQSTGGGEIDLTAAGNITLGDTIDVSGDCGGNFNLTAGGAAIVDKVNGTGSGDGGSGGCIDITGGTSAQLNDQLIAQGTLSTMGAGGGGGGIVCVNAQFGDLTVANGITAEGATPDGAGGEIDLCSQGATTIATGKTISVDGNGAQGTGGFVSMQSNLGINSVGMLDASGGASGGEIDLCAGTDLTLNGTVDISGRSLGAKGGKAAFIAGEGGQGSLSINKTLDVTGGGCGTASVGCGIGGVTNLTGCNLTVASTGSVLAGAPKAGQNSLTAREQLTINGKVNAAKATASGTDGANFLQYPSRKPAVIGAGLVAPAALSLASSTCTAANQSNCLIPCPVCGNGVVEFPETCDNNVGTPVSCDGCSAFCQLENCNDGNACTVDSCDPRLGCANVPVSPSCVTPTSTSGPPSPTPTRTPTLAKTAAAPTASATATTAPPTQTATPSATPTQALSTPTASATRTPSLTPTASATRTPTGTFTASATVTATPTRTATPIPSVSPTPTPTATPSPTVTATRTPSLTPTLSPTATFTASTTVTATATRTSSATPSASPAATFTATAAPSSTPSATRTPSFTPSPTPSASFAPTPTATLTVSATPLATSTPAATAPETPTPTSTVVNTPIETAAGTPTPGPPGDVNCDAAVTAADLPALVTLIASQAIPNACSNADVDGDGMLDENDINATISAMFGS